MGPVVGHRRKTRRGVAVLAGSLAVMTAVVLSACAPDGGGKINDALTDSATLQTNHEAVALIRFAPPDPACSALGMQIGVAEGNLYRPLQTLRLKQLAVTNVMEARLAPGTYHVLSMTCVHGKALHTMWEPEGNGLLRRSYATFTVSAGEVVNLGEIRAVRVGRPAGVHGSFKDVKIEIADWPLSELDRYRSQRPKLFAQMKTRLMTVDGAATSPGARCAELRVLQAAGKVQSLPAECASANK